MNERAGCEPPVRVVLPVSSFPPRLVRAAVALLALALLALGCGHGASGWDDTWARAADDDVGTRLAEVSGQPELTVTLRPRVDPSPGVAVYLDLRGTAVQKLRVLRTAPEGTAAGVPSTIRWLSVRDAAGPIDYEQNAPAGRYTLDRAPMGHRLHVSYLAESGGSPGRLGLTVSDTAVSGAGYSFLALPELSGELEVRLRWALDAIHAPEGASSFGVGPEVAAHASISALHHAYFVAGALTVVQSEQGDRLVVTSPPAFDPRAALDFCARALGAARDRFEPEDDEPQTFVLVPEPGLGSRNDGAAMHHSFVVWFDAARPLDDRLKLLIAHEMVHRWIGGTLRFVTPDGREALWFSEGFTVHFARHMLLRAGLIDSRQYTRDLLRDYQAQLATELAEDGHARRRYAALLQAAAQFHPTPAYSRGALYAARLQSELEVAGFEGVEDLVVPLMERVRGSRLPLPVSVWREAVEDALGAAAGSELERTVLWESEPVPLPPDVLQLIAPKPTRRHSRLLVARR